MNTGVAVSRQPSAVSRQPSAVSLIILISLLHITSCNSNLKVKLSDNYKCIPDRCVEIDINNTIPRVFPAGKIISLNSKLSGGDKISIAGQNIPFEVIKENTFFLIPKATNGEIKISKDINKENTEVSLNLFAGSDEKTPIYSGDPALICNSLSFYNSDGIITSGSKDCEEVVDHCSQPGQYDCKATTDFKAAPLCTKNETNCYLPTYNPGTQDLKAVDITTIDSNKMLASLTIAEITGEIKEQGSWDLTSAFPGAGYFIGISAAPSSENFLASATINGITGAITPCSNNGLIGCLTTPGFKSADLTNLSASNIKNSVVLAGITGSYPSPLTPLATSTVVADLPAFGPNTPEGSYEFFDSAGVRYSAIVSDGGNVTATSANQLLSAEGTMYRKVNILGDTNLTAGNIKGGTTIFGITGNISAGHGLCAANGEQDCVATGDYKAATACGEDGSNCYLSSYAESSQPFKAINYDSINSNKSSLRSSVILSGVTGTLSDCAAAGATGCYAGAGFPVINSSEATAAPNLTTANFNTP